MLVVPEDKELEGSGRQVYVLPLLQLAHSLSISKMDPRPVHLAHGPWDLFFLKSVIHHVSFAASRCASLLPELPAR